MFDVRTKHLSSLIDPQAKSVMDLGCGEMKLREYLAPEIKYIPVDYVKRSEETLVCDFNKHQFPTKMADTVFCSGVLEYIENMSEFVLKLYENANKEAIVSYCALEYKWDINERMSLAWKNYYTIEQFVSIFETVGFHLVFCQKSVGCNLLFKFSKKASSFI